MNHRVSPCLSEIKSEHIDGVNRQNWRRQNASDDLDDPLDRRIFLQG